MNETKLRALTAEWPGVAWDIKWQDDLVASVGGRMFCVYCLQGAQAGHLSFKVSAERFLEFTDRPGLRPAPYLARAHWVQQVESKALPSTELQQLIRGSYELAVAKLTRAQRRAIGAD